VSLLQCLVRNEFCDAALASIATTYLYHTIHTHPKLNDDTLYSRWDKRDITGVINDKVGRFTFSRLRVGTYAPDFIIQEAGVVTEDIAETIRELLEGTNSVLSDCRVVTGTVRLHITATDDEGFAMWLHYITAKEEI